MNDQVSRLLATLRETTGRDTLDFAAPPTPLSGGFYAEMYRFRLVDAPDGLDGELVARIIPDATLGEWEATVQRGLTAQGFASPAVRLTAPSSSPLGRYLMVMDHIDGQPPLGGLSFGSIATQIPNLVRRLPDQLAHITAALHQLDPGPIAQRLEALETEPATTTRVICHGDLHPFNLLVDGDRSVLVDWTVARIAHPAFDLSFTQLMLANPPIPLPKAGAALLAPVARGIARRFLTS